MPFRGCMCMETPRIQDLRDSRKVVKGSQMANPTYKKRIPNVPYLLANAGFEMHKENLFWRQRK